MENMTWGSEDQTKATSQAHTYLMMRTKRPSDVPLFQQCCIAPQRVLLDLGSWILDLGSWILDLGS